MKTTITVNGQTYSSVDDMPPEVRRQYESAMGMLADQDRNGIPHFFAGKVATLESKGDNPITPRVVTKVATTTIKVNGQAYSRWEDVPQSVRDAIEKARAAPAAIQANGPPANRAAIPGSPLAPSNGISIGLPWLIASLRGPCGLPSRAEIAMTIGGLTRRSLRAAFPLLAGIQRAVGSEPLAQG